MASHHDLYDKQNAHGMPFPRPDAFISSDVRCRRIDWNDSITGWLLRAGDRTSLRESESGDHIVDQDLSKNFASYNGGSFISVGV